MLKDTFLDITREKSSLRQLTKNYLFHKKIVHEFLQKWVSCWEICLSALTVNLVGQKVKEND